MHRTTIVLISICILFGTTLVVVLYALSEKVINEPNSFLRKYIPHMAVMANELDIKYNSYYFAGATAENIYLGNYTAPFRLIVANHTLTDTSRVRLHIANVHSFDLTAYLRLAVDSPYFYLMDGARPALFRGFIGEWEAKPFMHDKIYFHKSIPIGPTSFAIRALSSETHENILGKVTNSMPYVIVEKELLQKQIDGVFCTDGILSYSEEMKRLVYTYYYRNEFIVYDTNMRLDYRGHTIDTFSTAQVKVASIDSENKATLINKPKIINKGSCVSGKYLFINSGLLARNDIASLHDNLSTIDVYDIEHNSYKFSIYLQNLKGTIKMREFIVLSNKRLFALYDHYVVMYDLKSQYF